MQPILSTMNDTTNLVSEAEDQGQKVMTQTSPLGQEVIRSQLDDLHQTLTSLESSSKTTHQDLERRMSRWRSYQETRGEFGSWLEDAERQVAMEIRQNMELSEKMNQLEKRKVTSYFNLACYHGRVLLSE